MTHHPSINGDHLAKARKRFFICVPKISFIMTDENIPLTDRQLMLFQVESFLGENYQFRHNTLSGKTEARDISGQDGSCGPWLPVTVQKMNSIVRQAKSEGVGDSLSPRQDIEEYINSDAVADYDPIREYIDGLPDWDGRNHVAELFGRIPGIDSEQLAWCGTWLRSAVAHWLGMDVQHGNECVPVLIGEQGCGKSTFALRLLPPHLRAYYLDHINFGNKFDSEMALTCNLLVNIDEFANMGPSQQGKLKQTLSKVKVNGRPIFGKCQEDKRRYASFIATTNNSHPLCDTTGSRRYLCIRVRDGALIDNETPINYDQLYAQVVHELRVSGTPYWFSSDDVRRIQTVNLQYLCTDDIESMLWHCFRMPDEGEPATWISCSEIAAKLTESFPRLRISNPVKIRIGQTLKYMGCRIKHTKNGAMYQLKVIGG